MQTLFVTGGAGFIGSAFVLTAVEQGYRVVNLDKLTYSGNLDNVASLEGNDKHIFVHGDIGDEACVENIFTTYKPCAVVNFAAESHVDRSIIDPDVFVKTNVLGTSVLLRVCKAWWNELEEADKKDFRFLHVSTDEVFGTLQEGDDAFTEKTPFAPNSPYSASKAAADHFVRAYFETYGLPTLITNCSNNYGPRQFPEKLIPLMILNALAGKKLPIYGQGNNIRDWLHVEDHCEAILSVLQKGRVGESYVVGGNSEKTNMEVVRTICVLLDEIRPKAEGKYFEQVEFVADRLGHDFRYAIDFSKIQQELGFKPKHSFEDGIKETVLWFLENTAWVENVQSGEYRKWIEKNYSSRENQR